MSEHKTKHVGGQVVVLSKEYVEPTENKLPYDESVVGYCMRCKEKKPIQNPILVDDNKRKRIKGNCACGARLNRFVPKGFQIQIADTARA